MHAGEVETLARLWEREAYLLPVALYVDARDADPPPLLARFLARANGLILLDVREAHPGLGDGSTIFEIGRPLPREQEAAWAAALGAAPGRQPTSLATLFSFDAGTIHRLAAEAGNNGGLEAICRRTARLRMQGLAQRVEPRARLEQVVLPPEPKALLEQMLDQTRHRLTVYDRWGFRERLSRGLGISALFAGESGTGKTMAAEAMATSCAWTCTALTSRRWSASTLARRKRTSGVCSTRPRRVVASCFSTRPTLCSANARR